MYIVQCTCFGLKQTLVWFKKVHWLRIYNIYRHNYIFNGSDLMRKIIYKKVIWQNHAIHTKIGTYEENGSLNESQIVKYIRKSLSCIYQGSVKWT